MDWKLVGEIVAIMIGVSAGIYLGVKEYRERRARQATGLQANPTRCQIHEDRLREIELSIHGLTPRVVKIEEDIKEVKAGVGKLIDLHLKQ